MNSNDLATPVEMRLRRIKGLVDEAYARFFEMKKYAQEPEENVADIKYIRTRIESINERRTVSFKHGVQTLDIEDLLGMLQEAYEEQVEESGDTFDPADNGISDKDFGGPNIKFVD